MIMMKTFNSSRRLPAEWEEQEAVVLSWPHEHTDWAYMLDEVRTCFREIVHAVAAREKVVIVAPDPLEAESYLGRNDNITFLKIPTNDTWARDFGPVTVYGADGHRIMVNFTFNGWGLKFAANHDNLITRRLAQSGVFDAAYDNSLALVLEGGSIESDGNGTILSTSRCLFSPNRNPGYTRHEVERVILEKTGASRLLLLDSGYLAGDDTDSHIDTLARLAPCDTIIYCGPPENPADEHRQELEAMREEIRMLRTSEGNPYNLIELPMPDPEYDEDGMRLPATYANFLIINGAVLMPGYGQPRKDFLASQMIKVAFPDHEIITIDCRALIRQHGSLHCMTMQIPKKID